MPTAPLVPPTDFPPTDASEMVRNHQLAKEFAQSGTVKHFALRLGYMPSDERNAELILKRALREGEWWQEQAERLHLELEALRQQGGGL